MEEKNKKFNVLIIDDDPDDHFFIKSAIVQVSSDIIVTSVFDGTQGLKYLGLSDTRNGQKRYPDLILCDINMPLIDGFAFLKTVKSDESYRDVPVCMLTTSCDEQTKNKLTASGAIDCVIKPQYVSNYITVLALILNKVPSFDDF